MNHALVAELEVFVVVLPVDVVDDDESLARHCHRLRGKVVKTFMKTLLSLHESVMWTDFTRGHCNSICIWPKYTNVLVKEEVNKYFQ